MSTHDQYTKVITRSVSHIFKNFLNDETIEEVYETQAIKSKHQVAVEINGTLKGEVIINLPQKTLDSITKTFIGTSNSRSIRKHNQDVAGELANLITGTFANQMQYIEHDLILSPPEYNDDPISIKALYDNVNLSFLSRYGGFDIDLYYRDMDD